MKGLPLAACINEPPDFPADVAELARVAIVDGPAMLAEQAGLHRGPVALLVIHPDSKGCPPAIARQGGAAVKVAPLAELQELARQLGSKLAPPPGWFGALLVGKAHVAAIRLAPLNPSMRGIA